MPDSNSLANKFLATTSNLHFDLELVPDETTREELDRISRQTTKHHRLLMHKGEKHDQAIEGIEDAIHQLKNGIQEQELAVSHNILSSVASLKEVRAQVENELCSMQSLRTRLEEHLHKLEIELAVVKGYNSNQQEMIKEVSEDLQEMWAKINNLKRRI
ncbi:hypothetical protein BDN67DRAFT_985428, partial [Paxillus ammoniavirescens]